MEGDIVSAGTFVASVLEHAGYLTQARFMESFRDFFRDAGALVYFIGAVGGLLSLMMFGSFRAAQYLLIGPALYWFLVGPTTDVQGVVAKLGDGTPRGFIGSTGLDKAKTDRDAVITKSGEQASQRIKIAEGFWLFVKPINDFVEEFVGIMLKEEDESDLAVASKVRGLELIARAMPNDQGTIHLLENEILKNCIGDYNLAFGAAQNYIKSTITRGISSKNAPVDRARHKESFEFAVEKFKKSSENTNISINSKDTPILKSLIEEHGKRQGGSRLLASFYLPNENSAVPKITCAQGWDIYLERIWQLSANRLPVLLRLASGEWEGVEAEEEACAELTRKFYDDESGIGLNAQSSNLCDLRPGISLALLWNHMSRRDTFQKVLQRHSSDRDPLNATNQAAVVGLSSLGNKMGAELAANPELYAITNSVGGSVLAMGVASLKKLSDSGNRYEAILDWAPSATLNLIQGLNQSEQVDLPIYEMTRLRQQIFTWAMQLPYFQGLLLYMISVAYPFAALIVLLPGRAAGFLNIPLAWLWVKSWDIGFAAIILLEKVMYNMLPNWSVNPALRRGPWKYDQLPLVLGEGYNFGHAQAIGYHYTVLSMVALAMPAVMAAFTIKGKKAILSNFVDAASSQARDAGTRAASAHSISASNERAQLLFQIGGFAKQSAAFGLGGIEGGLKGTIGGASALMNVLPAAALNAVGSEGTLTGKPGQIPSTIAGVLANTTNGFLDKYAANTSNQAGFESSYRNAFDPMYGRWGVLQMSADAAAAALDGAGARVSGGFETNQAKVGALDAYMNLNKNQFSNLIETHKQLGEIQGTAVNNIVSKIQDIDDVVKNSARQSVGALLNIGGLATSTQEVEKVLAASMVSIAKEAVDKHSEGFDKNVAWARMWGMNPDMLQDPDLKSKIQAEAEKGTFAGHLYSQIYNTSLQIRDQETAKTNAIGGGPSVYMDPIIEGFGGNRSVVQVDDINNIKMSAPVHSAGIVEEYYQKTTNNEVLKAFGFEPAENIFLKMQLDKENSEKKEQPEKHGLRLENFIDKTIALQIFSDLTPSASPQETVKEIIEKAKIKIEEDQNNTNVGVVVTLPSNIETLAETNPITALEAVHTWHRKWASNNEKIRLESAAEESNSIKFNSDQILSRPYTGDR